MSLPRYRAYKDSGVDWLGEVPAHWQIQPLKSRYAIVGGSTPKSDVPEYWDGAIHWVTPADLSRLAGFEISGSLRTITDVGLQSCGTSLVPSGSLILSTRAPIGSLGLATVELCTNQGCKALVPQSGEVSRFAAYALSIAGPALNVRGKGTTFLELSGDELARFRIAFPEREEQAAIATFLDRETAKIDALIAEQEKLLALLDEKRQATISHAVTRGLDPNAPMKDSGIPWLGEVPAHWEVLCLKNVVVLQRGHDLPADARQDGDVPVVSSGGYIGFHSEARASGPGIVTGRYGSIGSFVYVEDDYWPLNTALYSVALHGNDARYVWYMLQSVAEHFVLNSMKSAVPGVDRNDLHTVSVVRAPNAEQKAIVSELDALLESLDGLSRQCKSGIQLLKERRSALIAAAVTGQIDVRGVMESQAA